MSSNPRFIELLESNGILTPDDSHQLLKKYKGDAYEVLLYLTRGGAAANLGRLWGDSLGAAYVDLNKTLFQSQVVRQLPVEFARKNQIIALYEMGGVFTVAAAHPENQKALKEMEKILGKPVSPVFSLPEEIEDAIEIQYQSTGTLTDFIAKIVDDSLFKGTTEITAEQLRERAHDQSIVELTRGLLLLAIRERASDIHIEPEEDRVRVRFRIDGVLHEWLKIEKDLLPPLVSRLKIMADLDITERRRPQDGRIKLSLSNKDIDFRVSTVPTIYGEKIVLRVLGQLNTREVPDLMELGFSKSVYTQCEYVISVPNGVFFVTGPTGSGKTTTLFSVLKHLDTPEVNIMTVEDPVEYRLPGVNQVQVNAAIGLDFARVLRAFLRQDPNVILIGEIRDMETAKTAAQAALTGHLVLATMHTNNAIQAVTRLVEIGVEPFLVAPSIIGVMAQRLIRLICEHCKEKYTPSTEELAKYFTWEKPPEVFFYRGKGCVECNLTGYSGRTAIHEIFILNETIRSMVARNASLLDIEAEAKRTGYKTMRYDGLKKVLRGLTTIDELERVTMAEEELSGP